METRSAGRIPTAGGSTRRWTGRSGRGPHCPFTTMDPTPSGRRVRWGNVEFDKGNIDQFDF